MADLNGSSLLSTLGNWKTPESNGRSFICRPHPWGLAQDHVPESVSELQEPRTNRHRAT